MLMSITTPAVLFPAISLLLLAYTNRFLALANIIRNFDEDKNDEATQQQIQNLRRRIQLIKSMQEMGILSFLACVIAMLAIYLDYQVVGSWIFAASLLLLLYSLWLSVLEIRISIRALDVHLQRFNISYKGRK